MFEGGTSSSTSTAKSEHWLGKGNALFPDPFFDMASLAMPTNSAMILRYCEFIVSQNPTLRQAIHRIVSYFCTDIDITDKEAAREEKQKFKLFMRHELRIMAELNKILLDRMTYGNAFVSVLMPFRRYLACPGCAKNGRALVLPLSQVFNNKQFNFQWKDFAFHATCPRCKYSGQWSHRDRPSTQEKDVRIKRWNPHEIEIQYDALSDECAYIWRIPESYRKDIRSGSLFHLERANWEVIKAVKENQHLRFDDGVVFHMREPTLAGQYTQGWGFSRILTSFRQAWYVQILRRYNEAIAADFVMPFRLLSPGVKAGTGDGNGDPLVLTDMADTSQRLLDIVADHRRDPATWHTCPFPVEYQILGGEARQLAPRELLQEGNDELLNGVGVPADMYRGTMSMQTAVTAMRLFESQHAPLIQEVNDLLKFVSQAVARALNWEPIECRLLPPTIADDVNQQMAKLQLMLSRQISQTSGLQPLNLDPEEENRRMLEEERFVAEEQAKHQKDMEGQQLQQTMVAPTAQATMQAGMPQSGMPAAGGMPPGGGGAPAQQGGGMPPGSAPAAFAASTPLSPNKPMSVMEMESRAQAIAQQLMMVSPAQKDSMMTQLKNDSPPLHSHVKALMEQMRKQTQEAAQQQGQASQASSPMAKMGGLLQFMIRSDNDVNDSSHHGPPA